MLTVQQRILVIDDDPGLTDFLRRGLSYEGYVVDQANSGKEGLTIARDHPPDVVILDVMMPGIDGLEVCKRLKAGGQIGILMLTARDTLSDKVRGLESGADDYLVKPFAFEELLARVHALLRRQQPTSPELVKFSDLVLNTGSRTARRGNREVQLSTTEFKLLELFARHPGQVLPRELIMERVWGYDFEGDSNILEVYVRYLRGKLEAGGEPRLIHTMRGSGYVLRE